MSKLLLVIICFVCLSVGMMLGIILSAMMVASGREDKLEDWKK